MAAPDADDHSESWLEEALQAERWAVSSWLEKRHKEMLKEFRSRAEDRPDYLDLDCDSSCLFDPIDSDRRGLFQVLGEPSPHIPARCSGASSSHYVPEAAPVDAIADVAFPVMPSDLYTAGADMEEDPPGETREADLRVTRSTYSSTGTNVNRATTSSLSTAVEPSNNLPPSENEESDCANVDVEMAGGGNGGHGVFERESKVSSRQSLSLNRMSLSQFERAPSYRKEKSFIYGKTMPDSDRCYADCTSLKSFVDGPCFESVFAFLIVANTCTICAQYQYRGMEVGAQMELPGSMEAAAMVWPGAEDFFFVTEWLFLVSFTTEIVVKLAGFRLRFFSDPWNYLDMSVVFLSLLDTLQSINIPLDPLVLRIMRLAKLLRLIKLAKTIKSFDSLYLLTASISSSLSALIWSAVLILVIQVLCALFLSTFLLPFCLSDAPEADREEVYRYFGTFTKAMLSMFELTLGNWVPITRLLTEKVNEWYTIFLIAFQVILGFAVIKVITGVFLTETMKVASMDDSIMLKTKQRAMRLHRKKMERLFSYADEDKDGNIAFEEFRDMFCHEEVRAWLAAMDLEAHTYEQVESLFRFLDRDNSGMLTIDELVKGVARLKGPAKNIDVAIVLSDLASMKKNFVSLAKRVDQSLSEDFR